MITAGKFFLTFLINMSQNEKLTTSPILLAYPSLRVNHTKVSRHMFATTYLDISSYHPNYSEPTHMKDILKLLFQNNSMLAEVDDH